VALADALMVLSNEWHDFIEAHGVQSTKISLVHPGVDVEKFVPAAIS